MTLALVLSFLCASCLALAGVELLASSPTRQRAARLRAAGRGGAEGSSLLHEAPDSALGRLLAGLAGRRAEGDSAAIETLRRRLGRAGMRGPASIRVFLGSRIACAVGLPILCLLWLPLSSRGVAEETLMLTMAAALGWVAPSFLLDRRVARRQLSIERGLPDALDLMVVCVEAGLGLTAAVARVSEEYRRANPALAEEFALVSLEAQAGKSNVDALRGLAERTGLPEVSSLVAMLVQTERFGTSIADALRVQAADMRRRRILRAEEAAAKAPLKMIFPAGVFIFPATLVVIAGPGVMKLIETLTGR